jgi:hypothetical protein
MGRYEFKFVVSDIDLSEEQEKRVEQAVAQAGTLAIAETTSKQPMCVVLPLHKVWCGLPPFETIRDLEAFAAAKAGERPIETGDTEL